jgi:hypothetical protein
MPRLADFRHVGVEADCRELTGEPAARPALRRSVERLFGRVDWTAE